MNGVVLESASNSVPASSMPSRPAIAVRCITAFVEPPIACSVRMPFSNASRVRMRDGRSPSRAISTIRRPAASESLSRRESAAGIAPLPGGAMPIASDTAAIVDAVPITMQCPGLRTIPVCRSPHSSGVMRPARNSASYRRQSVQEPSVSPRQLAFSCGPPVTMIAGTSADAAPISSAGVVLSQPPSRTTPSSGLARMDSSASMLIRLRNSMVVGRMLYSPSDMTGNSIGKPPACHTPRLTASASPRRCALQCVSSLHELQIPIIGLPS